MSLLFNDLPILDTTKEALNQLGFTTPTPIQALAIPKMIEGLDLIGQAQTGTGKTFAYAIPMVEKTDTTKKVTQGLILTPTRELTMQVYKEILKLVKFYPSLKVTTIVGGESYDKQFRELAKHPHIIVATPGRIIDHIDRKTVDLSNVNTLTLDEADEMLKMGFQEDLERILQSLPEERQTVLFSATLPAFIKKIASQYQKNPEFLKVEAETLTVDRITQGYFLVKDEDRPNLLVRLLDMENPKTAIIFANTKADVDKIAASLQDAKFTADALHGDLKQSQRNYVMSRFRNKQLSLLIATDVAARGLDISDVELVINYDLPQQDEVYVHRIGRTGRAGKKGKAYSFVTPRKRRMIEVLSKFIKTDIKKLEFPDENAIYKQRIKAFKNELKALMAEEVPNHMELLNEFLTDEQMKDHLLNTLLNQIVPVKKEYPELAPVVERSRRTETSRNDRRKGEKSDAPKRTGKYEDFIINLGKKDGMTPQNLFKVLEKEFGIYSKNVGDIKHLSGETIFGIKSEVVNKLRKDKAVNYQGKKVTVKNFKR
ncbi:DEAD/DEAH box helicase [Acholeplasma hippikon]|uniref:DEAD-box ATP-dependent RNA helicase n=1 Tax=Acholeplasma hippikon TaxID=264636 RepID=A0A449BI49_9MOLU|nr:DEAD/DEAH box helicase [Acholeplasma hippikon]VEU82120.1 DEAD-box ATP-dependent RNA helicase [Acholeplasma hippikon]